MYVRPVSSSTPINDLGQNLDFIEAASPVTLERGLQPGLYPFRWWSAVANRLGPRELRRRMWHMLPGLLPLVWWIMPHADPLSIPWVLAVTFDAVALAAAGSYWGATFSRPTERNCLGSSIGYATPVILTILLFPGQTEIGVAVFAIVAFGDGSATLGGLLLDGPALPWNPDKTWAGSLSFLLAAVPIATLFYWKEARPAVPWSVALLCAGSASIVAAIAESVSSRINDNIRVGVAAAMTMVILHRDLLGWQ